MSHQLSTDCLIKIFEILEDDKITLYSCLLVNRLWCKVSVRTLWRNIWDVNKRSIVIHDYRLRPPSVNTVILSTLVACLPNESKELLNKNEIFISTTTSKPPLFNYAAFCKVLSIHKIIKIIDDVLDQRFSPCRIVDDNCLVAKEILKMFMNQISSLKSLTYYTDYSSFDQSDISFINFPGARDCLADLSELCCSSDIHSEFFYKLSQICHNLQSLSIKFKSNVSNELKELISSQNNLKNLKLFAKDMNNWESIIPSLIKHSNTLTKLYLYSNYSDLPLSFVFLFSNLRELKFSFVSNEAFIDKYFNELQYAIFPKLQTLKIPHDCPTNYLMKFLEINGKNLEEFCIDEMIDNTLKLPITKFCPNLKKLHVRLSNDELDMLKNIFDICQHLESIKILCGGGSYLSARVLESVAKYSPKSFYELKIRYTKFCPEELESFFISWKNRTPMKLLRLIIIDNYYIGESIFEYIMKKYIDLSIIKTTNFKDDDEKEDDEFYNEGDDD